MWIQLKKDVGRRDVLCGKSAAEEPPGVVEVTWSERGSELSAEGSKARRH